MPCILELFAGSFQSFGSFGNEPMQSCSVHHVSLLASLASASASVCTALPVTGLMIETSYLTNIYSYALVYAHEILSQCDVYFLNGSHFSKFLYLALLST